MRTELSILTKTMETITRIRLEEQKNKLIEVWESKFDINEREIDAFRSLKREDFIPKSLLSFAYDDIPLPLMREKTISQPSTIIMMISALELEKSHRVFEIGTGSGYNTAIISKIIGENGKIVTTEIVPELVNLAKNNLNDAGIKNASVYEEDGSKGIKNEAPFDRIVITAACREFPKPLLNQLKEGGIIVGPVGSREEQEMVKGVKDSNGRLRFYFLGQFLFTPMYGKYGFEM